MEAATVASQCKRSLSRRASSSSSFRLRCPSLNSVRLRRVFDIFDKNYDGIITVQEIHQALTRLGLETDLYDLESTINAFINAGNIGLTYDGFVSLHQSLEQTFFGLGMEEEDEEDESDLTEAFKVFDEDGDGFISPQELQSVLVKLGLPEGQEIGRVERMICSVDENHDGRVDFFEFKHMMQSVMVHIS